MDEERFGSAILQSGGTWKSHPRLDFSSSIRDYFSLYFYENYTRLYEVYMMVSSLVFLSLLCWLYICFMTKTMYGSHHISPCI